MIAYSQAILNNPNKKWDTLYISGMHGGIGENYQVCLVAVSFLVGIFFLL